jgi:hypothetical protein
MAGADDLRPELARARRSARDRRTLYQRVLRVIAFVLHLQFNCFISSVRASERELEETREELRGAARQ